MRLGFSKHIFASGQIKLISELILCLGHKCMSLLYSDEHLYWIIVDFSLGARHDLRIQKVYNQGEEGKMGQHYFCQYDDF